MTRNPWGPRPDPKKRVITVSVTAAQDDDFERMKAELDLPTDSAVVKRGLEMLHAALAAVPADGETEWEYGVRRIDSGHFFLHPTRESAERSVSVGHITTPCTLVRRRKAGPWLPIPESEGAR